MNFVFSKHAESELALRQIQRELVEEVLRHPQQVIAERLLKKAYQSQVQFDGKKFLLRVIVDDTVEPVKVVTLYRTSKINKYWKL